MAADNLCQNPAKPDDEISRVMTSRLLIGLLFVTSLATAAQNPAPAAPANVENAVVKVFSTLRYPDPFKP